MKVNGNHFSIPCLGTDTIAVLKQRIEEREGTDAARISISFADDGEVAFQDEDYLCDCEQLYRTGFAVLMMVTANPGAKEKRRCALAVAVAGLGLDEQLYQVCGNAASGHGDAACLKE